MLRKLILLACSNLSWLKDKATSSNVTIFDLVRVVYGIEIGFSLELD